jgi:hypothetical protein
MSEEITLDQLQKMAARAGLKLSEDELQRLLPGVNRAQRQVSELRRLMTDSLEPDVTFSAASREKS